MGGGTVRDIRTGRAIGKTQSLDETFMRHIGKLIEADEEFYVVYGRCSLKSQRAFIDKLRDALEGIPVIFDRQMPSDNIFIFEGDPAELGFTA